MTIAIGSGATSGTAPDDTSAAIGASCTTAQSDDVAIGNECIASGGVAIGASDATGLGGAVAIGASTASNGGIALGSAGTDNGIAIGPAGGPCTSVDNGIAIGASTDAQHNGIAIGLGCEATLPDSRAMGNGAEAFTPGEDVFASGDPANVQRVARSTRAVLLQGEIAAGGSSVTLKCTDGTSDLVLPIGEAETLRIHVTAVSPSNGAVRYFGQKVLVSSGNVISAQTAAESMGNATSAGWSFGVTLTSGHVQITIGGAPQGTRCTARVEWEPVIF